jgi:hypothetical protein
LETNWLESDVNWVLAVHNQREKARIAIANNKEVQYLDNIFLPVSPDMSP